MTILGLTIIYLTLSVVAGGYAYVEDRPRDVILAHILFGPIAFLLIILPHLWELLWDIGDFLRGAWTDFWDRFR